MTKTHFSNLILAAVFSTAMAAPAIASASVPVKAGSSARAAHGTLVAGVAGGDEKKDEKKEKKDKSSADKGGKKDKAPAPTGGGW
jgi:hypothetical protein